MFDRIRVMILGEGGTGGLSDEQAELVDRFWDSVTADLEPDDFAGRVIRSRQVIDRLEVLALHDTARLAKTEMFEYDDTTTPLQWMRHHCKVSYAVARDRTAVAEQLPRLTQSVEAVLNGDIGFAHLVVMAHTAAVISEPTSQSSDGTPAIEPPFNETQLLEQAKRCTPGRFYYYCQRVRHALNPELVTLEQRLAAEERWLKISRKEDGVVSICGRVDSIGGATLLSAIEPLARPGGEGDDRCLERRQGDALVELANNALDSGQLPRSATQRPHLQVTTTLETLQGKPGSPAAEMEFAIPISSTTVQRIACDSSVARIVFGPGSVVVDAGRARRVVSPATRRALNVRDQNCRWPGCERPASWSAAHHLVHWIEGGRTDLNNLVLLCQRHHWMVHEGGWRLCQAEDGRLLAVPPTYNYGYSVRAPDETSAA
jgi:Domain of unknown function (DUF222)/HNH endonuclease